MQPGLEEAWEGLQQSQGVSPLAVRSGLGCSAPGRAAGAPWESGQQTGPHAPLHTEADMNLSGLHSVSPFSAGEGSTNTYYRNS